MEKLVEEMLSEQKRQDGTTNAAHAFRVRTVLSFALIQSGESPESHETLLCAALGHDLLEDSPMTFEALTQDYGASVATYIDEVTNKDGDSHQAGFVAQVAGASEEARLIKYADLCDNLFHASYSINSLGAPWMHSFFLPIVDPMREALAKTEFVRYPKTSSLLRTIADIARAHLGESIRIAEQN